MFSYDIVLFKESISKVEKSLEMFESIQTIISTINSISDNYDGKDIVTEVCSNLEKINNNLKELQLDMDNTCSIIEESMGLNSDLEINSIFSDWLFGLNLNPEIIEILNKIASCTTPTDFYSLFQGFNRSPEEALFLSDSIEDLIAFGEPTIEDYKKLLIEMIYYQEKENLDELKDEESYLHDRIVELESLFEENGPEGSEIDQALSKYKEQLIANRYSGVSLLSFQVVIDNKMYSFDTYEEGMAFINSIKEEKLAEIASLKTEKEEIDKKIVDFTPTVSMTIEDSGNITYAPINMTLEELIESTDFVENGLYAHVFGDNDDKNPIMTFLEKNKNPLGGVGCDQGIFKNMSFDDPEYIRLKDKLVNDYGFSKADAAKCFQMVDYIGACTYASVVDTFLVSLEEDPNLAKTFEESSGISLYTPEGDLNTTELLLDLFIYANDKENGGDYFYQENGKYHVFDDIQIEASQYGVGDVFNVDADFSDRDFVTVFSNHGIDSSLIRDYLEDINSNLRLYDRGVGFNLQDKPNYDNYPVYRAKKTLEPLIDKGTPIAISLSTYNSDEDLKVYGYKTGCASFYYAPGAYIGHAANVVGYDTNGIIIDTYGEFYYISWDSVASKTVDFDITGLYLDDGSLEE